MKEIAKHSKITQNTIIASVMILFSLINAWQIFTIKVPESRLMPILTFSLTFISGISLMIRSCIKPDMNKLSVLLFTKKEMIMAVLLLASVYLIEIIGFYTSSFLLVFAIGVLLSKRIDKKIFVMIILRSTVLMLIVFVMFTLLLSMYLPHGIIY
ncbi:MAG: tripartite tricarboxylate transporter TctB family protein [Sphaerochaetaceae bacterium]